MCYIDYEGFHEYLRALNADLIFPMLVNDCTTVQGHTDVARQARLQALLCSWYVKRRKLATFAVGDPLDPSPPSILQSAQNLASFWGDVHQAPAVLRDPPRVPGELAREYQQISPGIPGELEDFELLSVIKK
eukprot:3273443-Pyramimonas_sp.AAC.1